MPLQRGHHSCGRYSRGRYPDVTRSGEGVTRAAVTREAVTRTLRGPERALLVRPHRLDAHHEDVGEGAAAEGLLQRVVDVRILVGVPAHKIARTVRCVVQAGFGWRLRSATATSMSSTTPNRMHCMHCMHCMLRRGPHRRAASHGAATPATPADSCAGVGTPRGVIEVALRTSGEIDQVEQPLRRKARLALGTPLPAAVTIVTRSGRCGGVSL